MQDFEYIIIGDTPEYEGCLVKVCGGDREWAEKVLDELINNPSEDDKRLFKNHTNFRVAEVKSKDCWWNDPFLAN